MHSGRKQYGWGKLLAGVAVLVGILVLAAHGGAPPGITGEVIRHNQDTGVDATPYFYTEAEHIHDLQDELDRWWNSPDMNSRRQRSLSH